MSSPSLISSNNNDDQSSTTMTDLKNKKKKSAAAAATAVRYVEKRRTSTCLFGDRVATVSVELYKKVVSRQPPKQTCISTIVAYDQNLDKLYVVALGVGTKFLQESVLNDETNEEKYYYGERVRDCHAEVLARRAFLRYISNEILHDLQQQQQQQQQSSSLSSSLLSKQQNHDDFKILERVVAEKVSSSSSSLLSNNNKISYYYRVRSNITFHFYSSSAPCGNAVLKKFASMQKEKFRNDLKANEWPCSKHEYIPGHSIKQGQFALLLKKDNNQQQQPPSSLPQSSPNHQQAPASKKSKKNGGGGGGKTGLTVPPGTIAAAVNGSGNSHSSMGSIHTCSDKLLRWNCLGMQGSLLASLLEKPIYMSTLTVGRKFTEVICRRAVCCRISKDDNDDHQVSSTTKDVDQQRHHHQHGRRCSRLLNRPYRFNHPAILGTGVYMDETGVIDTTSSTFGQDVRFHSSSSWAWWPSNEATNNNGFRQSGETGTVECINGSTGYLVKTETDHCQHPRSAAAPADDDAKEEDVNPVTHPRLSLISTASLTKLYMEIQGLLHTKSNEAAAADAINTRTTATLMELRKFKKDNSPEYEQAKELLFTKHPLLRQWRRRQSKVTST